MLRRLELRRVRRQEEQMDMLGHAQPHAAVPAGPVERQYNLLVGTRANVLGEGLQFEFEERDAE